MELVRNQSFPIALPSEGLVFEWRDTSVPMLILSIHKPHDSEIAGLKAKAEFALSYVNGLIFVLARAANNALPWCDAPFSIHAYTDVQRPQIIKEISEQTRLMVLFVVVDAQDNRVKLIKHCTLSPSFTQELYRLLSVQRNVDSSTWSYSAALQEVQSRYTPEQLARNAIVRCFAGD